jgi:hypothetical protein
MMNYDSVTISGVSGTAYSKTAVGHLEWIKVTYTNGDAGGDVVVSDDQTTLVYLTLTNNNANKSGPLEAQVIGITGADIANVYGKMPVVSRFKVAVAEEAANSVVKVELWWSD